MTDTPKHIKDLQLKLWLAKNPGERLLEFITDNDIMFQELLALKKERQKDFEKNEIEKSETHQ
jgi:hypothetical protein